MEQQKFEANGRRKSAVARVILSPGKGAFEVNGHPLNEYLLRETLVAHAKAPLTKAELEGSYDVRCTARGGGVSGQAGAIRLGLARALVEMDPNLRSTFRKAGYLTRDPREVERKKYGQPKARKRFQFSKR
jgi:small subunit ribosomal protein S9